jgi:hypothetical protein
MIGSKVAKVISLTSTQIVVKSSGSAPGVYSLLIPCGKSIGYAR